MGKTRTISRIVSAGRKLTARLSSIREFVVDGHQLCQREPEVSLGVELYKTSKDKAKSSAHTRHIGKNRQIAAVAQRDLTR